MVGTVLSESCDRVTPDGLPSLLSLSLSLSTIQAAPPPKSILAHADGILTAGKFDLAFRFGGHAIAGCGTISPRTNSSQNVAVAHRARALQYQRTMHPAVSANNKADFDHQSCISRNQQRVRCGKSLWRPGVLTSRFRTYMGNVFKFGGPLGSFPDPTFAFGDHTFAPRGNGSLHGSSAGSGNC